MIVNNETRRILTEKARQQKIEVKGEQTPEKATTTRSRSASKGPAATPPPLRRYKPAEPEPAAEGSHAEGALQLDKTPIKVKEESPETRRSECPSRGPGPGPARPAAHPTLLTGPRENKWMAAAGSCGSRARVLRSTRLREHRMSNMTVSVTPAPSQPLQRDPLDPVSASVFTFYSLGDGDRTTNFIYS